VPDEAFRGPEAQLFEGPQPFNENLCRLVFPKYSCSSREITHSVTLNEKGRYAMRKMRKWKRMSYHKLRNRKNFCFSHHLKHSNYSSTLHAFLQADSCISLSKVLFPNSSLSILMSGRWFKRCWWLRNVNIDIAFNYSYTDLITRLWRYFGFVIPHSFSSVMAS